ncbi:response regulator [Thioalkalivibrio paradoxus]|uniref:response regulator n=1 Tax=Thioalkalivibrio paradoxus TaxID=108010 RepID=UPI0002D3DE2C|nr:response regulator [Thioalkalivibrio paradoxus]
MDNEHSILEGMSQLLEGWACAVTAADTADTAGALAVMEQAGRPPDLMLVDFHLDGQDAGLKSIAALRERWGDIPAVVVTADYGEEVRERVRSLELATMRKPVKPAALRAIMNQFLLARRQAVATA